MTKNAANDEQSVIHVNTPSKIGRTYDLVERTPRPQGFPEALQETVPV